MTRLYLLAIVILVLSYLSYNLSTWTNTENTDVNVSENSLTPDFIAETLKSNAYNDKGNLSHVIDAQKMEHYEKIDVTHFELPNLTLYADNEDSNASPWQVSAKEGTLYANNRVRLENRVKLVATDKDSLIQEIRGKYLELDLNTNIISSEQTILILGKGFTMYGSGLIVDINTKQMTLTEHVQTIYKKI